jgi:hypothetical protein
MARKRAPKGKRYPLNMRTTRELRDRIEAAAHASGRSLVQEVEYRLENSFRMNDLNEQIKAAVGEGFKEAMMAPLSEIGRFTPAERFERWAKRLAGIDPDARPEVPPSADKPDKK